MQHGARPDIFTFAMLGRLDVVRACIEAQPGLQRLHGPHGITLLKHAQAGGEKSAGVVEYLKQLGDADIGQNSVPIPEEWVERYLGEYSYGDRATERFAVIKSRNGDLSIRRGADGSPRVLRYQGKHEFQPAGAAGVTIRFEVRDSAVISLSIADGPSRRSATRLG